MMTAMAIGSIFAFQPTEGFLAALSFAIRVIFGISATYVVTIKATGVEEHRRAYVLEHLAAVVRRNLPIVAGLEVAAQEAGWRLRPRLRRLGALLMHGFPLSDAMGLCPSLFRRHDAELVRAGELSGNLPKALDLALECSQFRNRTLRSAELTLVYPLFLMLSAITITVDKIGH